MSGPKLNDGVLQLDGRVSTRATAKYLRGSASKARAVLDLIRGLDVRRADEVLQFTERAAAVEVRKVLASAVANAVHNDSQDVDELFVVACYADEGPTLKRFRPRARGRASRINKRTCHITVIVARMSDERLEIVQARQATGPAARRAGTSAQARRERSPAAGRAPKGCAVVLTMKALTKRALTPSTSPTTLLLKRLWKTTGSSRSTRPKSLCQTKRPNRANQLTQTRPNSLCQVKSRNRVHRLTQARSNCRPGQCWRRRTGRSRTATRSRATPTR